MTYYDPARLDAMRQMYEEGATLAEVGAAFCTCPENVYARFKQYGIPRRPPGFRGCRDPQRIQTMRQMYNEGVSMSEIARRYYVHPSAISHLFKRYGVTSRNES